MTILPLLFVQIWKKWKSHPMYYWRHTIAAAVVLMLFYLFPENFKLFTAMCGIFFLIYCIVFKNILYSLFALFIITQHFLAPGKYLQHMPHLAKKNSKLVSGNSSLLQTS